MPQNPHRDLTTKDVEARLKAAGLRGSRPTIIRWSDNKQIPHYRTLGGRYRMYRPEVIELLIRLWRGGATDIDKIKDQLFELHDQLAERDQNAASAQTSDAN